MAMAIKYKKDPDLEFLKLCDNDDLKILCDFMLRDADGDKRWTESLSSEERFKKCEGNYINVWDLIAGELQLFGGDTIANIPRRHGVLHRELLTDVCDVLKVNYDAKSEIDRIEMNLLLKVCEEALEKMTEQEKRAFAEEMNLDPERLAVSTMILSLRKVIVKGGLSAYKLAMIIADVVVKHLLNRGLMMGAGSSLARSMAIIAGPFSAGPIGILLTLSSFPLITGPAYRVTVPCAIQVAYMRQKLMNKDLL